MICRSLLAVCIGVSASLGAAQNIPAFDDPQWRVTEKKPNPGWQQPKFDDRNWTAAPGGFGTPGTPGARIGTIWGQPQIWLRREINLRALPERAALLIHHDEDAEVYLNGKRVAEFSGYVADYKLHLLDERGQAALRIGENLLAVHCRQSGGGQFIDVHVVDADHVPTLPPIRRSMNPIRSSLITNWGMQVTAENAWREYPRPQLVRDNWTNLNGLWDYAVVPRDRSSPPASWQGKILVPFCLESRLSRVQRLLHPDEALWYRRSLILNPQAAKRLWLHFEAVDYDAIVWLNDQQVGRHTGGNVPFALEISQYAIAGENNLVVRVEDATSQTQSHGKQSLNPAGIFYTRVSGIWQTVWLEETPDSYISGIDVDSFIDRGVLAVSPRIEGAHAGAPWRVEVRDGRAKVAEQTTSDPLAVVRIHDTKLWSPGSPHLYELDVALLDAEGQPIDQVRSYAAFREISTRRDEKGELRFALNGKEIFHWGALDQGWWPDGLLSPPSDAAMQRDIEFLKQAGFNTIRKHVKVEPRRYYYHCDRIGMMVWQDHVSSGNEADWTRLAPNPKDAHWSHEDHQQFMAELAAMVDTLGVYPSVVLWTPFNEAWGQHRTMEVGQWLVDRDPRRLVNIASGGNFWPIGNVVDAHHQPQPSFPFDRQRYRDFVKVVGEFGGHGWRVEGHLWDPDRINWGYGGLPKSIEEYEQRYRKSIERLVQLKKEGVAGAIYAQTTDVEGEVNGLLTYDRAVEKISAAKLRAIHGPLIEP